MRIEPIPAEDIIAQVLCSLDLAHTLWRAAVALERLLHVPLGAWVEEGQVRVFLQGPIVNNADFHAVHVEHDAGVAGVVAEDQVGVEVNVRVLPSLDSGKGAFGSVCGSGDLREDLPSSEGLQGYGARSKVPCAQLYKEQIGMCATRHGAQVFRHHVDYVRC